MAISNYTFQNGDSYPLLPTAYTPMHWELKHAKRIVKSESRSQRVETRVVGGGRIEGTFAFQPMTYADAKDLLAFLRHVEGGHQIFCIRIPTMDPDGSYDSSVTRVGEYYNLNRASANNQLVQYIDTGIVSPSVRDGGSVSLSARNVRAPTLKCSMQGPSQMIRYPGDSIIRVEIDVVERW